MQRKRLECTHFLRHKSLMPIKPKLPHPLREIRAVLEWTQPRLAKKLGVHPTYVRKIELGSRALTPELARRIGELTGAMGSELLKGSAGRALSWKGEPYSLAASEEWSAAWEDVESAELFADGIAYWTRFLFEAAAKKERLKGAHAELAAKLDEIAESFGLRMDDFMRQKTGRNPKRMKKTGRVENTAWKPWFPSSMAPDFEEKRKKSKV